MSTIPLPALNVRTPEQPDLLQKYGQLQALRNMQQQSQMQQQEAPLRLQQLQQGVQQGGLQLQQQQQALKNQQALTSAYQRWDGKSYDDLAKYALESGASGDSVQAIQQHGLEIKQKYATIAKDDAETGKNTIETLAKKNDMVSGALSNVLQLPDDQVAQGLIATAQQLAQQGLLDQQHVQLAQQVAQSGDPAKIKLQLGIMRKGMMSDTQQLDEAQKQALTDKEKAETSKITAETAARDSWLSQHPGKTAADYEIHLAGAKSGAEAAARMPYEMSLARQRQALSQGDPNAAGQLLVSGDATLSELKARGATPDFIAKTLFAARRLSGGTYNAQQADAQYQVAKSPTNVAFFGSANSLTDKGGTLDQLAEAAKDIPNGQIPVFNTIADVAKAATGSGPVAKYASLLLGVSDDYSKVMGGGQGSDSSRAQALHLVPANASPEARAAAIEGIRGAVNSQINSRIGNNPVLRRMYGSSGSDKSQPSVGDIKTFPNGAKGKWDGHGWVAQ